MAVLWRQEGLLLIYLHIILHSNIQIDLHLSTNVCQLCNKYRNGRLDKKIIRYDYTLSFNCHSIAHILDSFVFVFRRILYIFLRIFCTFIIYFQQSLESILQRVNHIQHINKHHQRFHPHLINIVLQLRISTSFNISFNGELLIMDKDSFIRGKKANETHNPIQSQ